jgi:SAM-dependent methyltransferase
MTNLRELGESAYKSGQNVAESLRSHLGTQQNTPDVIEIAYELQAGSYVRFAEEHPDFVDRYAQQLADFLDPQLEPGDVLLDAGAGELTMLSHMVSALATPIGEVLACDISEKMLESGRAYAALHMKGPALRTFRAELSSIPLPDGAVDVVTTHHAVEPNGGREREVLAELLRVAKRKLVLFEPCFELATDEARERMRRHGYVRDLAEHARAVGAEVESVTPLPLVSNPLNPTTCFVLRR